MAFHKVIIMIFFIDTSFMNFWSHNFHLHSGDEYSNGIYLTEQVDINNTTQWIYAKSHKKNNPVLLWVDDGPFASDRCRNSYYNKSLQEFFILVNWDQRGTGKSFKAVQDWNSVTLENYVDDLICLSEYVRTRFQQKKIFLLGYSWGSLIALNAVQKRPDLFLAYVGVSQHINTVENDLINYKIILKLARKNQDRGLLKKLMKNGYPPYAVTEKSKSAFLYRCFHKYDVHGASVANIDHVRFWTCPEHNLIDKINVLRGCYKSVKHIYPRLTDVDFMKTAYVINIPVYLFMGRRDTITVASLVEDYFSILAAPRKTFVWFEKSLHHPYYQEPEKFNRLMMEMVLGENYAG